MQHPACLCIALFVTAITHNLSRSSFFLPTFLCPFNEEAWGLTMTKTASVILLGFGHEPDLVLHSGLQKSNVCSFLALVYT